MNNLARLVSQIFGVILTLVGILGFIPALVPIGHLLGIFAVNPAAQLIHLATGLLGLFAGFVMGGQYARLYTLIFGIVYTIVAIVGFVQGNTVLGLIPTGIADNILHARWRSRSLARTSRHRANPPPRREWHRLTRANQKQRRPPRLESAQERRSSFGFKTSALFACCLFRRLLIHWRRYHGARYPPEPQRGRYGW